MNELISLFGSKDSVMLDGRLVYVKDDDLFKKAISWHGALAVSIAKWQFIVSELEQDHYGSKLHDQGFSTCALCYEYLDARDSCGGCPVAKHTGKDLCYGTPYHAYIDARGDDRLQQAKRELAYLESLQALVAEHSERFNYTWNRGEEDEALSGSI